MIVLRHLRALFLIVAILCHIIGGMTPASAQANQLTHQFSQNSDIAPICTGKGVVWVSLTQFYQTGELVVVEPPHEDNTPEHHQLVKCSLCTLFSSSDIDDQVIVNTIVIDSNTNELATFVEPTVTTKSAYFSARARSPPQILSSKNT